MAPSCGLVLARHRPTRVRPGTARTCGTARSRPPSHLLEGHFGCADEFGVVTGGGVRQRAANVQCYRKMVEALSRACEQQAELAVKFLSARDVVSVHEHQAEIADTSRHRSASTPWRCSRMRLQLKERRRRQVQEPMTLVKGAHVTADKAHMLLWRRTPVLRLCS